MRVGDEAGPSSWVEVTQERIDEFARVTSDLQWIHVDPERAKAGPFGTTVAHGLLTLSLVPAAMFEVLPFEGTVVNYGLNRVRFPAPVAAGSRVRTGFTVDSVEAIEGGEQVVLAATVEVEGGAKPACVAELVLRVYP